MCVTCVCLSKEFVQYVLYVCISSMCLCTNFTVCVCQKSLYSECGGVS